MQCNVGTDSEPSTHSPVAGAPSRGVHALRLSVWGEAAAAAHASLGASQRESPRHVLAESAAEWAIMADLIDALDSEAEAQIAMLGGARASTIPSPASAPLAGVLGLPARPSHTSSPSARSYDSSSSVTPLPVAVAHGSSPSVLQTPALPQLVARRGTTPSPSAAVVAPAKDLQRLVAISRAIEGLPTLTPALRVMLPIMQALATLRRTTDGIMAAPTGCAEAPLASPDAWRELKVSSARFAALLSPSISEVLPHPLASPFRTPARGQDRLMPARLRGFDPVVWQVLQAESTLCATSVALHDATTELLATWLDSSSGGAPEGSSYSPPSKPKRASARIAVKRLAAQWGQHVGQWVSGGEPDEGSAGVADAAHSAFAATSFGPGPGLVLLVVALVVVHY